MSVCPSSASEGQCEERAVSSRHRELMKSVGSACRSGPVLFICASAIYSFIYLLVYWNIGCNLLVCRILGFLGSLRGGSQPFCYELTNPCTDQRSYDDMMRHLMRWRKRRKSKFAIQILPRLFETAPNVLALPPTPDTHTHAPETHRNEINHSQCRSRSPILPIPPLISITVGALFLPSWFMGCAACVLGVIIWSI